MEYSAFRALVLAVTVTFSIEKAISWKVLPVSPPKASALDVAIPKSGTALPVNTAVGGTPPIASACGELPSEAE